MLPRRVQLKSSLTTVIVEAKKNSDEQRQYFQQEAREMVDKWHQNSLRIFEALQFRISELLFNDCCTERRDIAIEKPVTEMKKIDPSMPSLELSSDQPNVFDLIKSLEHFVEEERPIEIKNECEKSLQSDVKGINSNDPMFGFGHLPIVMTPSTASTTEPFMSTTFGMDFLNSPVTFSEYELNEIDELTLVSGDIENGNSGEQMMLPNASHKVLEQSNHSILLDKQQSNVNRRIKHTTDIIPLKRRKIDENAVPNAMKLLEGLKTGLMHKIIVDKKTLTQMREQKRKTKKGDATKQKATAKKVALSF